MTSKVFTKLFGLFVLLLVLQTVVVELVFSRMAGVDSVCPAMKPCGRD